MLMRRLFAVATFACVLSTTTSRAENEKPSSLAKNGTATSLILVPKNATPLVVFAAAELQEHVKLCSGAVLQVEIEGATQIPSDMTSIYLGACEATKQVGIDTATLMPQEYVMKHIGNSIFLVGYDKTGTTPLVLAKDADGLLKRGALPGWYDEQGTLYAVYDFLERVCGVRWLAPGELGTVCPKNPTLIANALDIHRSPAFKTRATHVIEGIGMGKVLWGNPSGKEAWLYWCRQRIGGSRGGLANHSFYGYYDRFWEKNPKNPAVFERECKEMFAKGYEGQPPQMCYTNKEFITQAVQDAKDYFDGKGAKYRAQTQGDYFSLVPMDGMTRICTCDNCTALFNREFENSPCYFNGIHSDYIFGFVNKVAKEIKKSHPDKYLATIAYQNYAYYPKNERLESNISVQLCLNVRYWWYPLGKENDMRIYDSWVSKEKNRPIYLWLYYCFPEEFAIGNGFSCFPGFFAHTLDKQIKMFAKDGIKGAFLNGIGEQVDTYLTFKLFDDPTLDVDVLLKDFFDKYYGAAGEPMLKLYLAIEEAYMNPVNLPDDIAKGLKETHETEEIAWRCMGTEERMKKFAKLIAEAKTAKTTEVEAKRIALFDEAVWQPMLKGKAKYEIRRAQQPQSDALKSAPLPKTMIGRIPVGAAGDPSKVDFSKIDDMGQWHTTMGYPLDRAVSSKAVHDGEFLYLLLSEADCDPAKLTSTRAVWDGDDWEIFFAPERKKPYRQLCVGPKGSIFSSGFSGGMEKWTPEIITKPSLKADAGWSISISIPLYEIKQDGIKPGSTFFLNIIRSCKNGFDNASWSPLFIHNFHECKQMGEATLQE